MARILSQTLIRSPFFHHSPNPPTSLSLSPIFLRFRNRSSRSEKSQSQLIEIDLDPDSSSSSDFEVLGMRKLEDAIHGIIVRRSAPDWLPFIPGASYWVPPRRRPLGVAELIGRLANPMTEEEAMSLTTVRGWPSSAYFIEGASSHQVETKSKKTSQSEDEEG